MKRLPSFDWANAFGVLFCELQAPNLTALNISFKDAEISVSWDVFEAVPALKRLMTRSYDRRPLGGALEAVDAALRHGGLRNLQDFELVCCAVADGTVSDFMGDFKAYGCSERLVCLELHGCDIGLEGVRAVAALISEGAFLALKQLHFVSDVEIRDVGVVALTKALLEATHTLLTSLVLDTVGVGDEGMVALIDQGRMEQLTKLNLLGNACGTDKGASALARAIEARGQPMLEKLYLSEVYVKRGAQGVSNIVEALIEGCPRLKGLDWGRFYLQRPGQEQTAGGGTG